MFIRQIHVLLFATYFERIYAQLSQLCENELGVPSDRHYA